MANEKNERLLNLVTLLLQPEMRTLAEITRVVPHYSSDLTNARAEFHRDKRQLTVNGFPVETLERTNQQISDGSDKWGYRLAPESSEVPEFGLNDEEAAAIRRALALVDLEGEADTFALWKLGGADPLAESPLADLEAPPALGELLEAITTRAEVRFDYHGREHVVQPHGLLLRRAHWYLSGLLIGDARRTYRVDRMGPVSVGKPGAFELPDWDPEQVLPSESWTIGSDDPVDVDVEVRGPVARWVEANLRPGSVISELDDAIVVRLSVSFVPAFVSWLMALGPDAVVLSPPAVVDHVRSWLAGVGGPGLAETAVAMSVSAEPTKTAPAIRWLRRTLAILQFLSRAGAPVATRDLADRFGVTAKQIIADLQLAACCGVPPYGPEDLFEITFSDDDSEVEMSPVPVLQPRHPGQLTPSEVVAVSTAGQVLLAMTSGAEHDLLAVAVGKVLHGLGASGHVRVALDSPPFAETLRAASRSRTRVHIDYFTASSRSITEDRLIEPLEVVVQRGRWYLDAFDVAHQSVRKFRIDRVLDVEPTDETFTRDRPSTPAGGAWPPADAPKVVMLAPPGSQWVAETHPASVQTEPDGRLRIELAVADWDWLETLLLQIGPGVTVVSPADAVDLPARSAAAVLARYP